MATDTVSAPSNAGSSNLATITDGDFEVISSHESKSDMEANLLSDKDLKDAASKLGKKGAEARKAKESDEDASDTSQKASDDADKAPEAKKDAKEGKPRHDPRARVQQAVRERNEARAEVERLRQELEAARGPKAEAKAEANLERAKLRAADLGVDLSQFEDYDEGVLTAAQRLVRAELAAYHEHTQRQQYESQTVQQDYQARDSARPHFQKWIESNPDKAEDMAEFLSYTDPMPGVPDEQLELPAIVARQILSSKEKGPLLAEYLMDHPEVREQLKDLSPLDVRVELRWILKTLGTAAPTATAPKVRVSQAPEPVRSVAGGGPSTADRAPGDDASVEEHFAYYNALDKNGRRKR